MIPILNYHKIGDIFMSNKLSIWLLFMLLASIFTFTGLGMSADKDLTTSSPVSDVNYTGLNLNEDNSTEDEDDEIDEEDEEDEEDEDDDDDGVDNDKESAYEREIETDSDDYQFKIKSSLKNGENKDKFELDFDVGESDQAEIELKFETKAGSNETELEYRVKFDEIVEFIDEGAPGYQNESLLTRYEIGKSGWELIEFSNNLTSGLITIKATTSDGVFTLIMRLANNFMQEDNVTLSPNSLKIDVLINDFDFNSTVSKLAVKAILKTEFEVEVDDVSEDELEGIASDETEVGVSSATASGYFSWSDLAMVDGQLINVISSSLSDSSDEEGEVSSKMYYTFNTTAPTNILWDPKVGVISQAAKSSYQEIVAAKAVVTSDPVSSTTDTAQTSTEPVENDDKTSDAPGFQIWVFLTIIGLVFVSKRRFIRR
jgi:hypothetical protein